MPYKTVNYTEQYQPIMQFNKNKTAYIHKWYPFVEGYAKEFINGIIKELDYQPKFCIEPFAGSGTTPVELQAMGIKCASFEVSPFMHLLSKTKLHQDYKLGLLERHYKSLASSLSSVSRKRPLMDLPPASTIVEREGLKKWLFNKPVMNGILDIKCAIAEINDSNYRNLFNIALASILIDVSNVFRNGKALTYKKDWQQVNSNIKRKDVHNLFLEKIREVILPDIEILQKQEFTVNNGEMCYGMDVRKGLPKQMNRRFDLLITSPPYLNSRDYTDIYRLELWVLDLIKTYKGMQDLRKETFISHVQINHGAIESVNVDLLKNTLKEINKSQDTFWNDIPNMINGYFRDMDFLFFTLRDKMIPGSKLFFNVANSAYSGVEVKVDEICSELAERNGFRVDEIRIARKLKTSAQQKNQVNGLRESVIVMTA